MGSWRTISVALQANTSGYSAGINKAGKDTAAFGKDVDHANRKIDELDARLGRAREGLALGIAAGSVAALGFATKAASDLREAQAASNVVFGEGAAVIESWANGAEDALGLSKKAAFEAASTYGAMFNQLGVGADRSAELSTSLVKLGVDFASFRNADPTAVLEAQSAAFRGEYDALQKFIPAMSAAAVEQQALADTGKTNADQLTQQEKALATYRVMVANAGDAVGDFARSNGSAATEAKKARAQIENSAASLGEALLPAAASAAKAVGFVADGFGRLPGPVQTGTVAVIGAAAAWARWGDTVSLATGSVLGKWRTLSEGLEGVAATRGITKTQAATEALKSSMSGAVGPGGRLEQTIGGIGVGAGAAGFALVGLGSILYAWQDERAKDAQRAQELAAAIGSIADEALRTGQTVEDVFASQTLPQSMGVTSGLFAQQGLNIGELNEKLAAGGDEWNRYAQAQIAAAGGMDSAEGMALAAAFRELQGQLEGSRVSTDAQRKALDELGLTIDPVTGETVTLTQALDGNTRAQGRAEAAARRTASAWADLGTSGANAFRGLGEGIDFAEMAAAAYTERALGVYEAQQAYDQSTVDLTAHQREAAEVQSRNAETARENAEAIQQHAEAVQQAADDVAAARETQAEAAADLAQVETDAQAAVAQAWADAQPTADAMVQAAERVTRAEEDAAEAAEAGRVAREGLNQALVDGAQYLRDLAEASSDDNRSVDRADLAYRKALAAQAELASKGSDDPFAQEDAALRVAEALDALEDARTRAAQSAQAQVEADKAGVEGTPAVLAAREAITSADEAEVEAAGALAAARKDQAETQWNAAVRLAEVQRDSAEKVAEAQGRLTEAADAVNKAQANLNTTQSASVELSKAEAVEQTDLGAVIVANALAKLDLAKAEAEANGKTLTAAQSAAILRKGLDEGRVATGFWSTDLQTLGQKLDYAASSRTVTLATQEALDRARDLGYKVETLPNGHIRVTADTSQADGALDALGMKIGALGSQLTGNLGAVVATATGGKSIPGGKTGGPAFDKPAMGKPATPPGWVQQANGRWYHQRMPGEADYGDGYSDYRPGSTPTGRAGAAAEGGYGAVPTMAPGWAQPGPYTATSLNPGRGSGDVSVSVDARGIQSPAAVATAVSAELMWDLDLMGID